MNEDDAIGDTSTEGVIIFISDAEGTIDDNSTRGVTVVRPGVVRDGNTQRCEVFLNWAGSDIFNEWRFSSCTVDNGSLLSPIVYGRFGWTALKVPASSVGTVRIGVGNIPVNETTARVKIDGLIGYRISPAPVGWLSAPGISLPGPIN